MTNEHDKHTDQGWQALLAEAATQCDADPEAFLRGAWAAYFEAHPGVREHLEQLHLMAELEQLRQTGRMAQA